MDIESINTQSNFRRLLFGIMAFSLISFYVLFPLTGFADALGGLISEKLVDRNGIANSSLLIERTGVGNPALDIGMAPALSTQDATNAHMNGGTYATLNGNVSDLNGFPGATVWFEWGYDTNYGNTVGTQSVAATGDYSTTLNNYDPAQIVHFRFASEADGTTYGDDKSFQSSGSASNAYNLATILPIIFLTIVILALVGSVMTGEFTIAALLAIAIGIIVGIVGLAPIQAALRALWGG